MRNVLLAIAAAVTVTILAGDAEARLFGGRSMTCNMGQVTQTQAAPTQATQCDCQQTAAPKVVSAPRSTQPANTDKGIDLAALAALNGNVPLGAAFRNVAAK